MKFYIAGLGIFDHFCSRDVDLNLINELGSCYAETYRISENKLLIKTFESYRLTD